MCRASVARKHPMFKPSFVQARAESRSTVVHVVVPGISAYDAVYKRLIEQVELFDVSVSFVIKVLKRTSALPLDYAR